MSTFIDGKTIVFTNNSSDPNIHLKASNGHSLVVWPSSGQSTANVFSAVSGTTVASVSSSYCNWIQLGNYLLFDGLATMTASGGSTSAIDITLPNSLTYNNTLGPAGSVSADLTNHTLHGVWLTGQSSTKIRVNLDVGSAFTSETLNLGYSVKLPIA